MVASELGFSFKVSSGANEIYRLSKEGQWDLVTTTAKDYPEINPGEKLVMVTGLSKPYEIDGKVKDPETGELKTEKVTMIKLEFGILDGRQRNARYLMSVSFRVTKGTNLGKIISGIVGDSFNPAADYPPESIARKPFYMTTKNEKNGDYLNIKFVDARVWNEDIDGPIPTATVTPIAQAKAEAKPSAEEIFNEDL